VWNGEMITSKGMSSPLQRLKIIDPNTYKDFEGTGIYTNKWEIALDNGELLTLTDYEAELYRLVVL
jgi:hypothetical protein